METKVTCGCNGKTYTYTEFEELLHFKSVVHINWIVKDSSNLYENIIIHCPCGSEFNLYNQINHLKSQRHRIWQGVGNSIALMPFICTCSFITPYSNLNNHRQSDLHFIPNFRVERKK